MLICNLPDIGLFNGSVGIVEAFEGGYPKVAFTRSDGKRIEHLAIPHQFTVESYGGKQVGWRKAVPLIRESPFARASSLSPLTKLQPLLCSRLGSEHPQVARTEYVLHVTRLCLTLCSQLFFFSQIQPCNVLRSTWRPSSSQVKPTLPSVAQLLSTDCRSSALTPSRFAVILEYVPLYLSFRRVSLFDRVDADDHTISFSKVKEWYATELEVVR